MPDHAYSHTFYHLFGADSYYKHQEMFPTGFNWAFSKNRKMRFLVGHEGQ